MVVSGRILSTMNRPTVAEIRRIARPKDWPPKMWGVGGGAGSLERTRLYKIACYVLLNRVVVRSEPGLLPIMMRFPQLIEDSPARLTGG